MKKTDYSNHLLGQEISGPTHIHEQLALVESVKAVTRALGVDSSKITILFGCVMTENGTQYDQTAGAVVYEDEIYFVDAFSGNHATNIPVYQFLNVPIGANVRFGDLQYREVHIDYKMELIMAAPGSNEANYNEVEFIKDKVSALIGMQSAIQSAITALVDSSPATLDTLNELAAALGDDPNFATTITNLIATKVAINSIVNSLTSTNSGVPLSAAQGKVLNDSKASITTEPVFVGQVDSLGSIVNTVFNKAGIWSFVRDSVGRYSVRKSGAQTTAIIIAQPDSILNLTVTITSGGTQATFRNSSGFFDTGFYCTVYEV